MRLEHLLSREVLYDDLFIFFFFIIYIYPEAYFDALTDISPVAQYVTITVASGITGS